MSVRKASSTSHTSTSPTNVSPPTPTPTPTPAPAPAPSTVVSTQTSSHGTSGDGGSHDSSAHHTGSTSADRSHRDRFESSDALKADQKKSRATTLEEKAMVETETFARALLGNFGDKSSTGAGHDLEHNTQQKVGELKARLESGQVAGSQVGQTLADLKYSASGVAGDNKAHLREQIHQLEEVARSKFNPSQLMAGQPQPFRLNQTDTNQPPRARADAPIDPHGKGSTHRPGTDAPATQKVDPGAGKFKTSSPRPAGRLKTHDQTFAPPATPAAGQPDLGLQRQHLLGRQSLRGPASEHVVRRPGQPTSAHVGGSWTPPATSELERARQRAHNNLDEYKKSGDDRALASVDKAFKFAQSHRQQTLDGLDRAFARIGTPQQARQLAEQTLASKDGFYVGFDALYRTSDPQARQRLAKLNPEAASLAARELGSQDAGRSASADTGRQPSILPEARSSPPGATNPAGAATFAGATGGAGQGAPVKDVASTEPDPPLPFARTAREIGGFLAGKNPATPASPRSHAGRAPTDQALFRLKTASQAASQRLEQYKHQGDTKALTSIDQAFQSARSEAGKTIPALVQQLGRVYPAGQANAMARKAMTNKDDFYNTFDSLYHAAGSQGRKQLAALSPQAARLASREVALNQPSPGQASEVQAVAGSAPVATDSRSGAAASGGGETLASAESEARARLAHYHKSGDKQALESIDKAYGFAEKHRQQSLDGLEKAFARSSSARNAMPLAEKALSSKDSFYTAFDSLYRSADAQTRQRLAKLNPEAAGLAVKELGQGAATAAATAKPAPKPQAAPPKPVATAAAPAKSAPKPQAAPPKPAATAAATAKPVAKPQAASPKPAATAAATPKPASKPQAAPPEPVATAAAPAKPVAKPPAASAKAAAKPAADAAAAAGASDSGTKVCTNDTLTSTIDDSQLKATPAQVAQTKAAAGDSSGAGAASGSANGGSTAAQQDQQASQQDAGQQLQQAKQHHDQASLDAVDQAYKTAQAHRAATVKVLQDQLAQTYTKAKAKDLANQALGNQEDFYKTYSSLYQTGDEKDRQALAKINPQAAALAKKQQQSQLVDPDSMPAKQYVQKVQQATEGSFRAQAIDHPRTFRKALEQAYPKASIGDIDKLCQQARDGKFPLPDKVKIVPQSQLPGKQTSSFDKKTDTIYLSQDLKGNSASLRAQYLKQAGNALDHQMGVAGKGHKAGQGVMDLVSDDVQTATSSVALTAQAGYKKALQNEPQVVAGMGQVLRSVGVRHAEGVAANALKSQQGFEAAYVFAYMHAKKNPAAMNKLSSLDPQMYQAVKASFAASQSQQSLKTAEGAAQAQFAKYVDTTQKGPHLDPISRIEKGYSLAQQTQDDTVKALAQDYRQRGMDAKDALTKAQDAVSSDQNLYTHYSALYQTADAAGKDRLRKLNPELAGLMDAEQNKTLKSDSQWTKDVKDQYKSLGALGDYFATQKIQNAQSRLTADPSAGSQGQNLANRFEQKVQQRALADPSAFAAGLQTLYPKASQAAITQLVTAAKNGNFPVDDNVKFVDGNDIHLKGNNSAYDLTSGTIYINSKLQGNPDKLLSAFTEENGHNLDALMGTPDAGKERAAGQGFLQLVARGRLDKASFQNRDDNELVDSKGGQVASVEHQQANRTVTGLDSGPADPGAKASKPEATSVSGVASVGKSVASSGITARPPGLATATATSTSTPGIVLTAYHPGQAGSGGQLGESGGAPGSTAGPGEAPANTAGPLAPALTPSIAPATGKAGPVTSNSPGSTPSVPTPSVPGGAGTPSLGRLGTAPSGATGQAGSTPPASSTSTPVPSAGTARAANSASVGRLGSSPPGGLGPYSPSPAGWGAGVDSAPPAPTPTPSPVPPSTFSEPTSSRTAPVDTYAPSYSSPVSNWTPSPVSFSPVTSANDSSWDNFDQSLNDTLDGSKTKTGDTADLGKLSDALAKLKDLPQVLDQVQHLEGIVSNLEGLPRTLDNLKQLSSALGSLKSLSSGLESLQQFGQIQDMMTGLPEKLNDLEQLPTLMSSLSKLPESTGSLTQLPGLLDAARELPTRLPQLEQLPQMLSSLNKLPRTLSGLDKLPGILESARAIPARLDALAPQPAPQSTEMGQSRPLGRGPLLGVEPSLPERVPVGPQSAPSQSLAPGVTDRTAAAAWHPIEAGAPAPQPQAPLTDGAAALPAGFESTVPVRRAVGSEGRPMVHEAAELDPASRGRTTNEVMEGGTAERYDQIGGDLSRLPDRIQSAAESPETLGNLQRLQDVLRQPGEGLQRLPRMLNTLQRLPDSLAGLDKLNGLLSNRQELSRGLESLHSLADMVNKNPEQLGNLDRLSGVLGSLQDHPDAYRGMKKMPGLMSFVEGVHGDAAEPVGRLLQTMRAQPEALHGLQRLNDLVGSLKQNPEAGRGLDRLSEMMQSGELDRLSELGHRLSDALQTPQAASGLERLAQLTNEAHTNPETMRGLEQLQGMVSGRDQQASAGLKRLQGLLDASRQQPQAVRRMVDQVLDRSSGPRVRFETPMEEVPTELPATAEQRAMTSVRGSQPADPATAMGPAGAVGHTTVAATTGGRRAPTSLRRLNDFRHAYNLLREVSIGKASPDHAGSLASMSRSQDGAHAVADALEATVVTHPEKMLSAMREMSRTPDAMLGFGVALANVAQAAPDRLMGTLLLTSDAAGGTQTVSDLFGALAADAHGSVAVGNLLAAGTSTEMAARGTQELFDGLTAPEDGTYSAAARTARTLADATASLGGSRGVGQAFTNLTGVEGGSRTLSTLISRFSRTSSGARAATEMLMNLSYDHKGAGNLARVLARVTRSRAGSRDLLQGLNRMADSESGRGDLARVMVRMTDSADGARMLNNLVSDRANARVFADLLGKLEQSPQAAARMQLALEKASANPAARADMEAFRGRLAMDSKLQSVVDRIWSASVQSQPLEVSQAARGAAAMARYTSFEELARAVTQAPQPDQAPRVTPASGGAAGGSAQDSAGAFGWGGSQQSPYPNPLAPGQKRPYPDLGTISEVWRSETASGNRESVRRDGNTSLADQAQGSTAARSHSHRHDQHNRLTPFRPGDVYSEDTLLRARICGDCGFRTNSVGRCARCELGQARLTAGL